jgi:hypothetical protein
VRLPAHEGAYAKPEASAGMSARDTLQDDRHPFSIPALDLPPVFSHSHNQGLGNEW